jgi:D-sedoheptulose 7-phosphate isomerase
MGESLNPKALFDQSVAEHLRVVSQLSELQPMLEKACAHMVRALQSGKKILWCGNGGSAADSQHLAAELVGRFKRERRALPSLALSTNTSILTAIGNDYGYDMVFRRQVEALGASGDVLIGLSTSGKSANVCAALELGREMGLFTIALTGADGARCAELAELVLRMPSRDTARIQEAHILCGHIMCDLVEREMYASREAVEKVTASS